MGGSEPRTGAQLRRFFVRAHWSAELTHPVTFEQGMGIRTLGTPPRASQNEVRCWTQCCHSPSQQLRALPGQSGRHYLRRSSSDEKEPSRQQ